MSSYVPAKYGTEYIFYVGLESVATAGAFQANPTIASGDFKLAKDGGSLTNLTTLPTVTPASGKLVKITLSATEMQCDNATVVCSDASGGEWKDLIVNIQTAARQIDDLAFPTTSGRSIDVTTTGEVGIDWANIGSPTTSVNLSGTTVKTATDVETDTSDIQSRLPAALVAGRIDASVGAMASGVVTATAIASDAITAAKIADGAIDAATFAAGAINAAAIATDAITDAKVASDVTIATVTGSVGSVVGGVTVTTNNDKTGYSLANDQSSVTIGTVNDLGTTARGRVNAEVLDVLNVDTFGESTGVPAATSTLVDKIRWLFTLSRNKLTQNATTQTLRNDADSATIATSTVSDDGTTMSRGEWP